DDAIPLDVLANLIAERAVDFEPARPVDRIEDRVPAAGPEKCRSRAIDFRMPLRHLRVISFGDGALLPAKSSGRRAPRVLDRFRLDAAAPAHRISDGDDVGVGAD